MTKRLLLFACTMCLSVLSAPSVADVTEQASVSPIEFSAVANDVALPASAFDAVWEASYLEWETSSCEFGARFHHVSAHDTAVSAAALAGEVGGWPSTS